MATLFFYFHIAVACSMGFNAQYYRGRNAIGWAVLTFFTSILITLPLLFILPSRKIPRVPLSVGKAWTDAQVNLRETHKAWTDARNKWRVSTRDT